MASDNFNRADAANLGANWTNQVGSIDIVSNQAKTTASGLEASFYSAESAPDNQYSQVVAAGVGASAFLGPSVRASGTGGAVPQNAYAIVWASSGAAQGLYKFVSGTPTLLQSITGGLVANDLLRVEANASTIICKKNGTQQGTDQSDGSLASGSPGLYNSQNASLNAIFEDWEGGALARRFFLIPN